MTSAMITCLRSLALFVCFQLQTNTYICRLNAIFFFRQYWYSTLLSVFSVSLLSLSVSLSLCVVAISFNFLKFWQDFEIPLARCLLQPTNQLTSSKYAGKAIYAAAAALYYETWQPCNNSSSIATPPMANSRVVLLLFVTFLLLLLIFFIQIGVLRERARERESELVRLTYGIHHPIMYEYSYVLTILKFLFWFLTTLRVFPKPQRRWFEAF